MQGTPLLWFKAHQLTEAAGRHVVASRGGRESRCCARVWVSSAACALPSACVEGSKHKAQSRRESNWFSTNAAWASTRANILSYDDNHEPTPSSISCSIRAKSAASFRRTATQALRAGPPRRVLYKMGGGQAERMHTRRSGGCCCLKKSPELRTSSLRSSRASEQRMLAVCKCSMFRTWMRTCESVA